MELPKWLHSCFNLLWVATNLIRQPNRIYQKYVIPIFKCWFSILMSKLRKLGPLPQVGHRDFTRQPYIYIYILVEIFLNTAYYRFDINPIYFSRDQ